MQYKIPIQIENEDTIVLGLSLRQLIIMMVWGGVAYGLFKYLEPRIGAEIALIVFAAPIAIVGIVIALVRVSEMTFLPVILNTIRLSLNSKARPWSQGTDSYTELEIGYIAPDTRIEVVESNKTFEQTLTERDEFADKLKNI